MSVAIILFYMMVKYQKTGKKLGQVWLQGAYGLLNQNNNLLDTTWEEQFTLSNRLYQK